MLGSGKNRRVLFVYSTLSTFSYNDLQILQKHFDVRSIKVTTFLTPRKKRDWLVYFRLIKGLIWSDIAYAWWADLNAFFIVLLCKLLHKKNIIVVGGYEVAYIPEINYGTLLSTIGRLEVKFILEHANKILAVSKFSKKEITRFSVPKLIKMVYNGVDTKKFHPAGPKKKMVLTVVNKISPNTISIKNLDTFLKASEYLPDIKFIVVGGISSSCKEVVKKKKSPNVEFTGYLDHCILLDYYQKTKVYCQLSTRESFGVALVEAMSCECIPVITKKTALPEIVGNIGFYVPHKNPEATANAISRALISDKGLENRERVKKHFSLEGREKKLIDEISDLSK